MLKFLARAFRMGGTAAATTTAATGSAIKAGTAVFLKTAKWVVPPVAITATGKGIYDSFAQRLTVAEGIGQNLGLYDARNGWWVFSSEEEKAAIKEQQAQATAGRPSVANNYMPTSASAGMEYGPEDQGQDIWSAFTNPIMQFFNAFGGGNLGQSLDKMFSGVLQGKGGISGVLMTLIGGYLAFAGKGIMSKIAGAALLMFGMGSSMVPSRQQNQPQSQTYGQSTNQALNAPQSYSQPQPAPAMAALPRTLPADAYVQAQAEQQQHQGRGI